MKSYIENAQMITNKFGTYYKCDIVIIHSQLYRLARKASKKGKLDLWLRLIKKAIAKDQIITVTLKKLNQSYFYKYGISADEVRKEFSFVFKK